MPNFQKIFIIAAVIALPLLTGVVLVTRHPKQTVLSSNTNPVVGNTLDCSQCSQAGNDGICFNTIENRSYCTNLSTQNIGYHTICNQCAAVSPVITTPTPGCTPPPPCLFAIPRCEIPEPIGGWCPAPSLTPPIVKTHLRLTKDNFTPANCGFSLDTGLYVCATAITAAPNPGNQSIIWNSSVNGLPGITVTPSSGKAGNLPLQIQFTVPKSDCTGIAGTPPVGLLTFADTNDASDKAIATFNCGKNPVVTPPPGCHIIACTRVCPINNPNCCPIQYECSPSPVVCGPKGMQVGSFNPNDSAITNCVTPTQTITPPVAATPPATAVWQPLTNFFQGLFHL